MQDVQTLKILFQVKSRSNTSKGKQKALKAILKHLQLMVDKLR